MDPGLYFRAGSRKKREVVAPIARAAFPAFVEIGGTYEFGPYIAKKQGCAPRISGRESRRFCGSQGALGSQAPISRKCSAAESI